MDIYVKGKQMRTLFIHVRKSIKLMIILIISLLLILGILYFLFRPMYAVKLNGELIGYVDTKKQLEEKIEDYKKSGDGEKVAFYEIDQMPDYEVCYSKKDVQPDEESLQDPGGYCGSKRRGPGYVQLLPARHYLLPYQH